jgi:hypothetical protein
MTRKHVTFHGFVVVDVVAVAVVAVAVVAVAVVVKLGLIYRLT